MLSRAGMSTGHGYLREQPLLAQVLRDTLNCTLPIEIIYNGPGEMDSWAVNKFQVTPSFAEHSGKWRCSFAHITTATCPIQ